jgi:hypothetical protein
MAGALLCARAAPAVAKDVSMNPAAVDLYVTVSAVREVPAGKPMPGLHLDAKVKGRMMDIYIAPMDFAAKYGVKIAPGDEVHIGGTEHNPGEAEVVLAREITTGAYDNKTGFFRETLTTYLRNDAGPLWE